MAPSLPVDLYPYLLSHISTLSQLALISRVDRTFLELSRKRLYENCWIRPWEEGADRKFRLLMSTLAQDQTLARLVKQLDVRFYPVTAGPAVEDLCVNALSNMTELEGLIWTRDTTFTAQMIQALTAPSPCHNILTGSDPSFNDSTNKISLPNPRKPLKRLEINGHLTYPASNLLNFIGLEELRIVMPKKDCLEILNELCRDLRKEKGSETLEESTDITQLSPRSLPGLKSLELISQASRLINDQYFTSLAPSLEGLESFKLLGCAHLGPKGYLAVLRSAQKGLQSITLEGCGDGDEEDMLDEDLYLERESPLSVGVRLQSVKTLSLSETVFQRFLLADRSRQELEYTKRMMSPYDTGAIVETQESGMLHRQAYPTLGPDSFLPQGLESLHVSRMGRGDERATAIITAACDMWPNLQKLWFTDYSLSVPDLDTIVTRLKGLDSLMIRMYHSKPDPKLLAMLLSRLPSLRVFHLQAADRRPGTTGYNAEDLRFIAQMCGPKLEQIGWANRVYLVKRRKVIDRDTDGATSPKVRGWGRCADQDGSEASVMTPMRANVLEKEEVYVVHWHRQGAIPEALQVWRV